MVKMEDSWSVEVSTPPGGASVSNSGTQMVPPPLAAVKKRRNVAGMPDPDADVLALSPNTLMATNRFVCEVCNKGFQRDQNLQLHRRGHNLPWKLRQRKGGEVRKRVYVCPVPSCVHHHPSRALGDLTGIKKHFSRKHGEKKWNCERCSKKYAVKSDLKAHVKTCGTKEYICDCGTLFSRKDSFITHRAFCDSIAQEKSPGNQIVAFAASDGTPNEQTPVSLSSSSPQPPLTPSGDVVSPVPSIQSPEVTENPGDTSKQPATVDIATSASVSSTSGGYLPDSNYPPMYPNLFKPVFLSQSSQPQASSFSDVVCTTAGTSYNRSEFMSMSLSPSLLPLFDSPTSLVPSAGQDHHNHHHHHQEPALSATALLQKAAQVGSTGSSSSFLRSLGLGSSLENEDNTASTNPGWLSSSPLKPESNSEATFWLGLGSSNLSDMSMGVQRSIYTTSKEDALDLGLGISLLTSMGSGGGLDGGAEASFGGVSLREEDSWKGQ